MCDKNGSLRNKKKTLITALLFFIVIINILFFYSVIFRGESFFFRDIFSYHYPMKHEVTSQLKDGVLPLWNHKHAGGQPMLANPNYSVLNPMNLLFLILPLELAFSLSIVFAFIAGSMGVYFLCRFLGCQPLSSFLGAIFFSLSGPICSMGNLFNGICSVACIPWIFLFVLKGTRSQSLPSFGGLATLIVIQFFCGEPVISMITAGGVIWIAFTDIFTSKKKRSFKTRSTLFLTSTLVLALLACAIQIIPTLELLGHSSRGAGFPDERSTIWSFHPARTVEFFYSGIFGNITSDSPGKFWGNRITDRGIFYIINAYIGFIFPIMAFFCPGKKQKITWIGLGVIAFLLSFGRHLPLFSTLHTYLFPMKFFRYPEKFLVLFVICISVLGASGLNRLFREENSNSSEKTASRSFIYVFIITVTGIGLLYFFSGNGAAERWIVWLSNSTISHDQAATALQTIINTFIRTAAITLTCAVLFSTIAKNHIRNHLWKSLIALIIIGELFSANISTNPTISSDQISMAPVFFEDIKKHSEGSYYPKYNTEKVISSLILKNRSKIPYIWITQGLGLYKCYIPFGLSSAFSENIDGLLTIQREKMFGLLKTLRPEDSARILKAAGVRFVVTDSYLPSDNFMLIRDYFSTGWPVRLYEIKSGCGEVFCTKDATTARDSNHAIQLLAEGSFNPFETVIVEEREMKPSRKSAPVLQASCKIVKKGGNTVRIEAENSDPCFLVYTGTHYPGWRVYVDGRKQNLLRANGGFLSTHLEPGFHRIEFRYSPSSVTLGMIISLAGFLGIFFLFMNFFQPKKPI